MRPPPLPPSHHAVGAVTTARDRRARNDGVGRDPAVGAVDQAEPAGGRRPGGGAGLEDKADRKRGPGAERRGSGREGCRSARVCCGAVPALPRRRASLRAAPRRAAPSSAHAAVPGIGPAACGLGPVHRSAPEPPSPLRSVGGTGGPGSLTFRVAGHPADTELGVREVRGECRRQGASPAGCRRRRRTGGAGEDSGW